MDENVTNEKKSVTFGRNNGLTNGWARPRDTRTHLKKEGQIYGHVSLLEEQKSKSTTKVSQKDRRVVKITRPSGQRCVLKNLYERYQR